MAENRGPGAGVLLITGGARGIGRAIAELAAERGWAVSINYRKREDRAREVVERLRRQGTTLAWEPRGIWQADELEELAESLAVLLVRDLSRDEEVVLGPIVYTRLLALGDATHVKSGVAYDLAEKLAECDRAFVVMEGTGAKGAAKIMRENLDDATN